MLSRRNLMPHAKIAATTGVILLVVGVLGVKERLSRLQEGPVLLQSAELQRREIEVLCHRIFPEHDDQLHAKLVVRKSDSLHRDGYLLAIPSLAHELQPVLVFLGQHSKNDDGDVAPPDVSDLHAG